MNVFFAQLPYLSYSAHIPDHAFLLKVTMATEPPIRLVHEMVKVEVKSHRHSTPLIEPHFLHVLHASVGVDGLLYLFAKVFSMYCISVILYVLYYCHTVCTVLLSYCMYCITVVLYVLYYCHTVCTVLLSYCMYCIIVLYC